MNHPMLPVVFISYMPYKFAKKKNRNGSTKKSTIIQHSPVPPWNKLHVKGNQTSSRIFTGVPSKCLILSKGFELFFIPTSTLFNSFTSVQ